MATVRLTDVIIPAVYLSYTSVNSPELTAFAQSGVAVSNGMLQNLVNGESRLAEIPFWKDLDSTEEPQYSNDDPADKAVPSKVGTSYFMTRRAFVNKTYSAMDMTAELAGSNPMQQIRNRFGVYWQRAWQRRLLASVLGIYAENKASGSSDMIHDVAIEDGNAATSANLFARDAFVSAAFTLGDQVDGILAMAIHSIVYKRMVDNDDIEFIPDSKGALTIPTYLGRRVIVDDGMPVIAGTTSGYKYVSVLFGAGAIGYGLGAPANPVWVFRDEFAGQGGGMETIGERHTWLIHPFGYKWNESTVSQESPSVADLKLAANWTRQLDRKLVPLAFLITNG